MGNGLYRNRRTWFYMDGLLGVYVHSAAKSKHVNKAELEYIEQDSYEDAAQTTPQTEEKKMSFQQCFGYKQTWAFAIGKFMTDGVWCSSFSGHLPT